MTAIDLRLGEMLQGDFDPGPLNLLLAFQVNCPGCFTHALPLASALYDHYSRDDVTVIALSTVFEDFSLNTAANTRQLLDDGSLVGETAKHFQSIGVDRYPQQILFPVAMDAVGSDSIGRTFSINHFPGTPTWILFDSQSRVMASWFGHRDEQEVRRIIDDLIAKTAVS
ncbi:MAG: TlpA family protein disulfide reductase [Thermodesulfobacteriota bacterium]